MSRDIDTSVITAISGDVVTPFFAVDLVFDSAPLYIWSGNGDLTIGDKTYIGAGSVMNISSITETNEMQAKGVTISVSGIPTEYLSLALTEPYQGRECRIYFGMVDNPNDYVEVFSGELDKMDIEETAESSIISISAENSLIKLERPVVRRLTNQDQKSRFPNDLGLEFLSDLQEKEIFWGRKSE